MRDKKGEFTIVWSWEDIQCLADENDVTLSKKDCIDIIEEVKRGARDVMVAHGNEVLEQCMNESEIFERVRDKQTESV